MSNASGNPSRTLGAVAAAAIAALIGYGLWSSDPRSDGERPSEAAEVAPVAQSEVEDAAAPVQDEVEPEATAETEAEATPEETAEAEIQPSEQEEAEVEPEVAEAEAVEPEAAVEEPPVEEGDESSTEIDEPEQTEEVSVAEVVPEAAEEAPSVEVTEDAAEQVVQEIVEEPSSEPIAVEEAQSSAVTEQASEPTAELAASEEEPSPEPTEPTTEIEVASAPEAAPQNTEQDQQAAPEDEQAAPVDEVEEAAAATIEEDQDALPDTPPQFDLVRIDKAGAGLVAGRGDADSEVEIVSDGEVVGAARTGRDGAFVAYILVDPAKGVQSLTARHRRSSPNTDDPEPLFQAAAAPVVVVSDPDADHAPVIVQPNAEGVSVIQAAPRVSAEQVSLDAISYDNAGRVVFAGRAAAGQNVRLYLDGRLIADANAADDSSWRTQASDRLKPGVYTLRVDQIDGAGKVTSRIETPFQREAISQGVLGDNSLTVQTGNNLWKLAEKHYGEGVRYTLIYKANEEAIRDPDLIYPGQIFTLPDEPRSGE